MKQLIIAAGILAFGSTLASAQVWTKEAYPYAKKYHSACQVKARDFRAFEVRAKADGKLTKRERDKMNALQRDLDKTCGRYRMTG